MKTEKSIPYINFHGNGVYTIKCAYCEGTGNWSIFTKRTADLTSGEQRFVMVKPFPWYYLQKNGCRVCEGTGMVTVKTPDELSICLDCWGSGRNQGEHTSRINFQKVYRTWGPCPTCDGFGVRSQRGKVTKYYPYQNEDQSE